MNNGVFMNMNMNMNRGNKPSPSDRNGLEGEKVNRKGILFRLFKYVFSHPFLDRKSVV